MIAFPYVALGGGSGPMYLQPYGVILLTGIGVAVVTAWRLARRYAIPARDWAMLPIAIAPAFACAHFYDVIFYRWAEASREPAMWMKLFDGMSLMGALFGVIAFALALALARGIALGKLADVVAVACLVAMTIGRVGCALVHDHLGVPTESAFGVDMPGAMVWNLPEARGLATIRVHDLGLEELLVLLPITGAAFAVFGRLRAGMVAALAAIAYATVRFALDFLRLPMTEPRHAELTAGQWGCIVLFVLGVVGLALSATRSESGSQSGTQ